MGWLLSKIYDRFTAGSEAACLTAWRLELLRELQGEVLEIGAGTGVNLPHYPTTVQRLVASEPDRHMRAKLALQLGRGRAFSVELVDANVEALPFAEARFDAVVSTLVLCSVPSLRRALAEIHRVLVPGGRLVFLEHVAAQNRPDRLKWQHRVDPLWSYLADGCHLNRETEQAIRDAGFEVEQIERESIRKAMPLARPSIRGFARKV